MQKQIIVRPTVVELEKEEKFMIPDNCWAFIEAEGKRTLITATSVKADQATKLTLIPKVAGG